MLYESPVMEVIILEPESVRTGMEPSTSGTGGMTPASLLMEGNGFDE